MRQIGREWRRGLLVLLLALGAGAIAGCGGGGNSSTLSIPSNFSSGSLPASKPSEGGGPVSAEALATLHANGGLHAEAYANYDTTAGEIVASSLDEQILDELVPGVTSEEFGEAIKGGYARLWRERDGKLIDYCGMRVTNPEVVSPSTPVKEGEELGFSFACKGER